MKFTVECGPRGARAWSIALEKNDRALTKPNGSFLYVKVPRKHTKLSLVQLTLVQFR